MRSLLWLGCLIAVYSLSACQVSPASPPPDTDRDTVPTGTPIAKIHPTRDTVEVGLEWNLLTPIPVAATGELHENEALRVANGGEALLDFGFGLWMHLFHDTEMGVVSIDSAPNAARWAEFEIFKCCVTGQLTRENTQIVYRTPGGAEIQIYGTTYFIIYDPYRTTTIVGNFDGQVRVISGGREISLPAGFAVTIPMDQPPDPPQPIDFLLSEIEDQMRNTGVVVATAFYSSGGFPTIETPVPTETSSVTRTTPTLPVPTRSVSPSPTITQTSCARHVETTSKAWCRSGPGTVYEQESSFNVGITLNLLAQNPDPSIRWWKVAIPDSRRSCWISDSLVRVDGITSPECVPIEQPPPTPTFTPVPPTATPTLPVLTPTPSNQPPPAPQNLNPDGSCCETFPTPLSWDAVSDSDGIAYYHWEVEDLGTNNVWGGDIPGNQTSFDFNSSPPTDYRWRVRAVDNANLVGAYSAWATFTVP